MKRVYCDFCAEQIMGTFICSFGADYHTYCWDEKNKPLIIAGKEYDFEKIKKQVRENDQG